MGTSTRNRLWCSALLLALASLIGNGGAEAQDRDKRPLFNTFQLPGANGSYTLTLRQDRTFSLTDACGISVSGQFNASDREIGLWDETAHRHFSYDVEGCALILEPTSKDTPSPHDLLGSLPPLGRGMQTAFQAGNEWSGPSYSYGHERGERAERAHPSQAFYRPSLSPTPSPYLQRGHFETRTESVLVEAARREQRWVPPVYETRAERWGRPHTVLISAGHMETVEIPARYETRQVQVWVGGR